MVLKIISNSLSPTGEAIDINTVIMQILLSASHSFMLIGIPHLSSAQLSSPPVGESFSSSQRSYAAREENHLVSFAVARLNRFIILARLFPTTRTWRLPTRCWLSLFLSTHLQHEVSLPPAWIVSTQPTASATPNCGSTSLRAPPYMSRYSDSDRTAQLI